MALEASHIRFAVDALPRFAVRDKGRFIAGTVYPDSRYYTGINRTLTHDKAFMSPQFWQGDDFKTGWALHLIYDKLQYNLFFEMFSDLLPAGSVIAQNNPHWITITALKILQDQYDCVQFPLSKHLAQMNASDIPNNELPQKLDDYYHLIIDTYATLPPTLDDYETFWVSFSGDTAVTDTIIKTTADFARDELIVSRARSLHQSIVEKFKNYDLTKGYSA